MALINRSSWQTECQLPHFRINYFATAANSHFPPIVLKNSGFGANREIYSSHRPSSWFERGGLPNPTHGTGERSHHLWTTIQSDFRRSSHFAGKTRTSHFGVFQQNPPFAFRNVPQPPGGQANLDALAKKVAVYNHYRNGIDAHLDLGVSKFVSEKLSIGIVGFAYQQLTDDSGQNPLLGGFKGRTMGVGPQISYTFNLGGIDIFANLRGYKEFNVRNRVEGDGIMLTLSLPL